MITIEEIKAQQTRLNEMIATVEAQMQALRIAASLEADIGLHDGEHYAGVITGKDGAASYRLILLPGEAESVTWLKAKQWAAEADGELPTRREQALLYANLKEQFQPAWYWSSEQHATKSDCAWLQNFNYGTQNHDKTDHELRARAVRRLVF